MLVMCYQFLAENITYACVILLILWLKMPIMNIARTVFVYDALQLKSVTNYERVKLSTNQRLFEYALIVSLKEDGLDVDTGCFRYIPHLIYSFPPEVLTTKMNLRFLSA